MSDEILLAAKVWAVVVAVIGAVLVVAVPGIAAAVEAGRERRFMLLALRASRRANPAYRDDLRHPSGRLRKARNRFAANPVRFVIGPTAYAALGLAARDVGLS